MEAVMAKEPVVPYRGMRYFKCDLQMQTHMDRSGWRGASYGGSLEDTRQAAREYILRSYEVGLEVIAITDHNFASKDFIATLNDAVDELTGEHGYRITIFPGFEINADVGKGVHCLALFDPQTPITEIDHVLITCGVPFPRFKPGGQAARSTKRLPEILNEVQKRNGRGQLRGIAICPHAQAEAGIFDNNSIAEWLQQEEFLNPELLCIEVPKPPSQMSENWQRLLRAGPDCLPDWRRRRPIACIMSSDAKALRPEDGAENYIGFRYTWIKMSEPSIEALRQAFLDPESRIRLDAERPEDKFTHPRILSMNVKDAVFLSDQTIGFSPNLNTIIGGRGTGKSTIVEYLRIALQQENTVGGHEASKNLQKLRKSLKSDSLIEIAIEKEGAHFRLRSIGGLAPTDGSGEDFTEIARFFPCRVFSQREIFEIADSLSARRQLVEDIVRMRLDELSRREEDLIREIGRRNQQIEELPALQRRARELRTEIKDLMLRIARLDSVMEPLAAAQRFDDERTIFDGILASTTGIAVSAHEFVQEMSIASTAISERVAQGPYADLVVLLSAKATAALQRLTEAISTAVDLFKEDIEAIFKDPAFSRWQQNLDREKQSFDSIKADLELRGTDPDEYLNYQAEIRQREQELLSTLTEIERKKALQNSARWGNRPKWGVAGRPLPPTV